MAWHLCVQKVDLVNKLEEKAASSYLSIRSNNCIVVSINLLSSWKRLLCSQHLSRLLPLNICGQRQLFHVSSSYGFFCLARCGFRLLPSFIHLFHVSSSYGFFCLARCGFRRLPSFRWDALCGIYSDVTLPYGQQQQPQNWRRTGNGTWGIRQGNANPFLTCLNNFETHYFIIHFSWQ